MNIIGFLDVITDQQIAGWAADLDNPSVALQIELVVDGRVIEGVDAASGREDLTVLGLGSTRFGFVSGGVPREDQDRVICRVKGSDVALPRSNPSRAPTLVDDISSPTQRFWRQFHRPIPNDLTPPELLPCGQSNVDCSEVVDRILRSFHIAAADSRSAYSGMWGFLATTFQGEFIGLALNGRREDFAAYLAGFSNKRLAQGFMDGPDHFHACGRDRGFRQSMAFATLDRLLSLAEAVGVIAVENPEQGSWGKSIHLSPDYLLLAVAKRLGIDIRPPVALGNYYGLAGGFNTRVLDAIYSAYRIKQVLDQTGGVHVCEVGAGAGLTAYYARIMGVPQYTIVDLPTLNAVQAFVLGNSMDVSLYAEDQQSPVHILPTWCFGQWPKGSVDLVFNQDSLPEIEKAEALKYFAIANDAEVPTILSINQESGEVFESVPQNVAGDLIRQAGGYSLVSRHRAWMRVGYCEETYRRV